MSKTEELPTQDSLENVYFILEKSNNAANIFINILTKQNLLSDFVKDYLGEKIFAEYEEELTQRLLFFRANSDNPDLFDNLTPIVISYKDKDVSDMLTIQNLISKYITKLEEVENHIRFTKGWNGMKNHVQFTELVVQKTLSSKFGLYLIDPHARVGLINKRDLANLTDEEKAARFKNRDHWHSKSEIEKDEIIRKIKDSRAQAGLAIFTEEQCKRFILMWNNGYDYKEIKSDLESLSSNQLTIQNLYDLRSTLKLTPRLILNSWNTNQEEELLYLINTLGMSIQQASLELGRTVPSVTHKLQRLRSQNLPETTPKDFITHKDLILQTINQKVGWSEIIETLREQTNLKWTKESLLQFSKDHNIDILSNFWDNFEGTGIVEHLRNLTSKRTSWKTILLELEKIYPNRKFTEKSLERLTAENGIRVIPTRLQYNLDHERINSLYLKYGSNYKVIAATLTQELQFKVSEATLKSFIKRHLIKES